MKNFFLARVITAALSIGIAAPAMAAISSNFDAGTGTLTISSDANDALAVSCQAGSVAVNAVALSGPVLCNAVVTLNVDGGPGANSISLAALTATDLPLLSTVSIDGGADADTIVGSFLADVIHGDAGADTIDGFDNPVGTLDQVFGDGDDDTLIWNPGKDDDLNEGGPGNDVSVINGGGAAETFTITTSAGRVRLDRTNPAPFFVDIGSTERLTVNGNAGDDSIVAQTGLAGLILLTLNGDAGNDTITGSNGVDTLNGGADNDVLTGLPGNDTFNGGDGDDRMIWNNGDNTDVFEGGNGNDTGEVNGATGATGDVFTIAPNGARVRFDRTNLVPFSIDIGTTEQLNVNGNAGDDSIVAQTGLAGLILLTLSGDAGNDTITGSNGVDTLNGGTDNDVLTGLPGNDTFNGGDGDDRMIWNNGDNTDVFEGGNGNDTGEVNGATGATGDVFTIAPNAARVRFDRTNLVPFSIDIGSTEKLVVNGNAGDDSITAGAGLNGLIALELNGGDNNDTIVGGDGADILRGGNGNDSIDGNDNPAATLDQMFGDDGDDTLIWNPGKDDDLNEGGPGNDTSVINGGGAAETFTITTNAGRVRLDRTNPAPFFVDIGSTEKLIVNGNAGDDSITGGAGLNGLIALELNGGDNNDTIVGGDGVDVLHGGNGNDTLDGNDNPAATIEQIFGDDGDDVMTWNPGKDDDLNEGGPGFDIAVINGGSGNEQFRIVQTGARVRFDRTNNAPAPFFVDIGSTERLQLNAAAGGDRVTTMPLDTTEQILNGGDPATQPGDELIVIGFTGDLSVSPVAIPGLAPIEHLNFEFAPSAARATTFTAALDGAQEVPAVDTTGEGRGTVSLNAAENQITVNLAFANLGGNNTMAHIHGPAAVGANADVLFNLGNSGAANGVLGPLTFAVSAQQVADLKAGLWYFNVHSTANPTGEIRGQIIIDRVIESFLTGAQQIPGVATPATGFGTVTLAGPEDEITVTLNYIGLAGNNTATSIRGPAPRGQNGAAIFDLSVSGARSDTFTANPIAITPAQAAQLKRGDWYFDVRSSAHPEGELRGQIDNIQFLNGFE